VITAFPDGAHPVAVRTFMTIPTPDLSVQGTALSPRDWLRGGGDPVQVVALAGTLGDQV